MLSTSPGPSTDDAVIDPYKWWLLVDVFLFVAIAAVLYLELRKDSTNLPDYDAEQESSGWEMRRKFHRVLFVAATGT